MWVFICRAFGVTPVGDKTGKREAAWAAVALAAALTVYAVERGVIADMVGVLVIIWPSALALVAAAYKLEHDKQVAGFQGGAPLPANQVPESWPDTPIDPRPGAGMAG